MRPVRKMMLLVLATAAVMALSAPSASATSQIETTKADGATHCPTLPSGGCHFHWEGERTMFFHIFGFEGAEAKCHIEIRGRVDEDRVLTITSITITAGKHDADCTNATAPPCAFPWPGAAEKDADGKVRAHYDMCIDPAESGICQGEFITDVTESGTTTETQTQGATDQTLGGSFCEFTESWTSEAVAPEGEETHIKSI